MKIELGTIYLCDYTKKQPYINMRITERVLLYDKYEILYDEFVFGDWVMNNLNSTSRFSRVSRKIFEEVAEPIDIKPLTREEMLVFRPDLPIRVCRDNELSWNNDILKSISNIENFLKQNQQDDILNEVLEVNKLYLEPYGKSGGKRTAVLVEATNGKYFTSSELLYKSNDLQSKVNPNRSKGVGIYRTGIKKRLPVYYIGEYIDAAEIMLNSNG